MSWYYADAGQQTGPVDDAQFDALVASGKITSETLVWQQGLPTWVPLSQVRPGGIAPPAAGIPVGESPAAGAATGGAGGVVCCECGQTFAPEQTIRYGDRYVCAACKPAFLQRLAEGVAPGRASVPGTASPEEILQREYSIDIGTCLSRSWELFTANPGLLIGAYLVIGLVFGALWAVMAVIGLVIPFVGNLASIFITGPLVGGVVWFTLRLLRGESPTVGDMFSGFSRQTGQLILGSVVQGLITLACMLPFMVMAGVLGFSANARRGQANPEMFTVGLVIAMAFAGLIAFVAIMYLTTVWIFSYFLMMDKRMKFWDAMQLSRRRVAQRFWMTLLFIFVGGLISGAGVVLCFVGLLVSMPLYWGMLAYLYEDNFRDLAEQG